MLKKIIVTCAILAVSALTFTAAYADTGKTVNIPVKYDISGGSVESTFTLKAKGTAPMPEGSSDGEKSIKKSDPGKVDFGDITFTEPNLYEYTVSKHTEDSPGLTKDERVYNVFVLCTEEGETTTVIKENGKEEKIDEIVYADTLIPPNPKACYDDPPVLKKVQGKDNPQEQFTFRFEKDGSKDLPMPGGSEEDFMDVTVKAGQEEEFGIITFTKAGVYNYKIYEVDTGLHGYTYDKTVFNVKYTVTEENGQLVCVRTVSSGGKEERIATFTFTNIYNDPVLPPETDTPKVPPIVEKIQKSTPYQQTIGRITKTGDSFNPFIMLVTMLIAGAGIGVYLISRRKNNIS